jgi:hypothetical protein
MVFTFQQSTNADDQFLRKVDCGKSIVIVSQKTSIMSEIGYKNKIIRSKNFCSIPESLRKKLLDFAGNQLER